MTEPTLSREARMRGYWRANRLLIALLLVIWAVVSYGFSILFIEPLNTYRLGGVPLGFWFAQQGSIYVFVVLIFVYAFGMDRLDKRYGFGVTKRAGTERARPGEQGERADG